MSGERPDLSGYAAGSSSRRSVPVSDEDRDPVDPVRPPTATTKPKSKPPAAAAPPAAPADEVTLQFNTRLSQRHRAMLTELVDKHPYGRLATMRLVVEEAIDALAAARREDRSAGPGGRR